MRFIVCAKDRESGETFVVGGRSYPSKDEAIGALSGTGSVGLLAEGELFLVDLDKTTPVVLVMPRQPVVAVSEGPSPDDSASTSASGGDDAPAPLGDEITWPFVTSLDEGVGAPLFGDEIGISDADRSEVWWLEVGSERDEVGAPDSAAAAPESPPETIPDSNESAQVPDLFFTEQVPEEALFAVDEPAALEECEELPAVAQAAGQTSLVVLRDDSFADVTLVAHDDDGAAAFDDEGGAPLEDVWPEEPQLRDSEPQQATFVMVDFDAWTCGECVFTVTCDRSGVDRPSSCVSFQWKPE